MKLLYLVLVVFLIYVGVSLAKIIWASTTVDLKQFEHEVITLGTGPSLRYIAGGDSSAVGVGASSVELSYANMLAGHFAEKNEVLYKNIGLTGARTTDVIKDQLPLIIEYSPDVVTISIGANDATHLVSSKTILKNFETIISELTEKTSSQIYMTALPGIDTAKILPWPFRKYLEFKLNKLNNKIIALESDRVKIVDIRNFGWEQYEDLDITFAKDRFHPSDEGYQNWKRAFLSKIEMD